MRYPFTKAETHTNTRHIRQAVLKSDFKAPLYRDVDHFMQYLSRCENFKPLSAQLTEIMEDAHLDTGDSTALCARMLHARLAAQRDSCGEAEEITLKTVRRWFDGTTQSIRSRNTLIRICYALELSPKLSSSLLNKCGQTVLSSRSAEDLVHMYCIQNQRPYGAACDMIRAFRKRYPEDRLLNGAQPALSTEEIFHLPLRPWQDDEDFFRHCLLANASSLIGCSHTVLHRYYLIRNELYVLHYREQLEQRLRRDEDAEDLYLPLRILRTAKKKIYRRGDSALQDIWNNLSKHDQQLLDQALPYAAAISDSAQNGGTRNELNSDSVCRLAYDVVLLLQALVEKYQNRPDVQQEIAQFCEEITRRGCFLDELVASFEYRGAMGWSLPCHRISSMPDPVVSHFPQRPSFRSFEAAPARSDDSYGRRLILLLYFLLYSFEFRYDVEDVLKKHHSKYYFSDPSGILSGIFGQGESLDAVHFYEQTQKLLEDCFLAPLYLGNQFDALLAMCVRAYQCESLDIGRESPFHLFTKLLTLSYSVEVSESNFPDSGFLDCVERIRRSDALQDYGDIELNRVFTPLAIANILEIDCSRREIQDLTGIGQFTALTRLDCSGNQLTELDLRHNRKLTFLNCSGNHLTHLDVGSQMTRLICDGNRRRLPQGTALTELPGFDPARAREVTGGSFEGGEIRFAAPELTYIYDCGGGHSASFTLVRA